MTADRSVVIEFGEFAVRPHDFLLVRAGQPCRIEPTPFRVLLFLLRNPGRLITKDELVRGVWTDCSVTDNSLTRSIATLRRLLGDNFRESKYIETVPRVGYRFRCPVSVGEDDLDRPATIDLSNREFVDSIAVLPFENPAGERDVVDFGYGVEVGVTDSLSRLPRLRVVRCTAAFKDKELGRDAVRAGYQLGARVVLTGHLALEGRDLAIQVELIDTEHRAQLWSAHFRRRAEDVYAVQAEIAEQIANKLKPGIDGGRRSISFSQPIESERHTTSSYVGYIGPASSAQKG
jgi:DNA-binding winged helix-turn-helix (wHTH) protein